MTDLVRYYREYYREQTPSAFDDLFRCMLDYDFSSYHEDMRRVFAMHSQAKCMGDTCILTSGGSSNGSRTHYFFGPNFHEVKFSLEGFLRMSENKTLLIAKSEGLNTPRLFEEPNPPQYDLQVVGDWAMADHIEFLFDTVEALYSDFGPINLCALPCLWLGLTCDPRFVERTSLNSHKINALVNTDNIACFRGVSCPVRDQMFDWRSGVNFYTCGRGRRHFLPVFLCSSPSSCHSLINMKRTSGRCDDVVSIDLSPAGCPCGLPSAFMEFVPHERNYPVDSAGARLNPQTIVDALPDYADWFQLLQKEDGSFGVFFHAQREKVDFSRVFDHISGLGMGEIELDDSRYFSVGRKRPLLWRRGVPNIHTRR